MELLFSVNQESDEFIHRILEIDALVYPKELQGTFASASRRFGKNRDSYLMVAENSRIIGYFCFFPIRRKLLARMFEPGTFFDDDIAPEQILPYDKINDLFIISMAIHPKYQDGKAIKILLNGFENFLSEKERNGFHIKSISCYVTSEDGEKLAKAFGMQRLHGNFCHFAP